MTSAYPYASYYGPSAFVRKGEPLGKNYFDNPKQNNQTTTSNFPCNFNFAVSNMNRFNQGIYHG